MTSDLLGRQRRSSLDVLIVRHSRGSASSAMSNSCHSSINQLLSESDQRRLSSAQAEAVEEQDLSPHLPTEDDLCGSPPLDATPLCSNGKAAAVSAEDGRFSEAPW